MAVEAGFDHAGSSGEVAEFNGELHVGFEVVRRRFARRVAAADTAAQIVGSAEAVMGEVVEGCELFEVCPDGGVVDGDVPGVLAAFEVADAVAESGFGAEWSGHGGLLEGDVVVGDLAEIRLVFGMS